MELDHGVFVSEDKQLFIAFYVDDLLLFEADLPCLKLIQKGLFDWFRMTDLGEVFHYLGMEVNVDVGKTITLKQTTYLKKVLKRFGIEDCSPISIPMDPGVPASLLPFDEVADRATLIWYQSAIGCLIWPALHTWLDISEAVGVLSQYCSNPGPLHVNHVNHVFCYIVGTLTTGVTFRADWAHWIHRRWLGQNAGWKEIYQRICLDAFRKPHLTSIKIASNSCPVVMRSWIHGNYRSKQKGLMVSSSTWGAWAPESKPTSRPLRW